MDAIGARRALGRELRRVRTNAGRAIRQVPGVSDTHVSRVENGHVLPSRNVVLAYVELGGDRGRLLALLDRARRVAADARSAAGATRTGRDPAGAEHLDDPHADPRLLRRGYAVEMIDDTFHFGPDGEPVRNDHAVRVHPFADARFFPFRFGIHGPDGADRVDVDAGAGCRLVIFESGRIGVLYGVLDFAGAPTDEAGARSVTWTIHTPSSRRADAYVSAGSASPLPRTSMTANFHVSCAPVRIWWYRDFDDESGRIAPRDDDRFLARHRGREPRYRRDFVDLEREWWGLAWVWP